MGLPSAAAGAAARSSSSLLSVVAVGVGVMRPVFIPSSLGAYLHSTNCGTTYAR